MKDYYNTTIYLNTLQDILEFVKYAARCDFHIHICKNGLLGYMDGKTLIGLVALAGEGALYVYYNGKDRGFEQVLHRFSAGTAPA